MERVHLFRTSAARKKILTLYFACERVSRDFWFNNRCDVDFTSKQWYELKEVGEKTEINETNSTHNNHCDVDFTSKQWYDLKKVGEKT